MERTEWPEYRDAVYATIGRATPEHTEMAHAPLTR